MEICDRPIAPRSPWQNPYVERLIGTLRRECFDHVLIFGERHLHRVLTLYSLYYNETRTHLGSAKDAPIRRAVQRSGPIVTSQFYPDYIIATPGSDFQEGQGYSGSGRSPRWKATPISIEFPTRMSRPRTHAMQR